MKIEHLVILLPCQSLEDFQLDRNVRESEQILAAWAALWHPAVLKAAGKIPTWAPAEDPPHDLTGYLVMLPDSAANLVAQEWMLVAEDLECRIVGELRHRDEFVDAALAALDEPPPEFDPALVGDFYALGFGYLLVELLTRQLRYMSNLDEETFRKETLSAVEALYEGDVENARVRLQAAFDLLHEAREYFYPVEAHLLDLTLVARSTIGAALRAELASPEPTNLLLSAEVLEEMARREPETLTALLDALKDGSAAVVGGEFCERPFPLMPPEAILRQLQRGLAVYEKYLAQRPKCFARRQFGLSPRLPQILEKLQFTGALHFTLDDGSFPVGNQSRVLWQGFGAGAVEAVGRIPLDATQADAFLRFPENLGDWMDLDHAATVVLAHWPGQSSPWYHDLKRIADYTTVVGSFTTIANYFEETGYCSQQVGYTADQYRSPYLLQAVRAGRGDPISRWVRYYRRRAKLEAAENLDALAVLVAGKKGADQAMASSSENLADRKEQIEEQIEDLLLSSAESGEETATRDASLAEQLDSLLDVATRRLAASLSGQTTSEKGVLAVNPWSFAERRQVDISSLGRSPDVVEPVRAVDELANAALVDIPPMGFSWVGPGSGKTPATENAPSKRSWLRRKPAVEPPMAEELTLRNEFFEVKFDEHTGAIRSVFDYRTRGARLAQQLALRTPRGGPGDPGDDRHYSIMAADEIRIVSTGPMVAEMLCRGRLVDQQNHRLAGYQQTTRIRRGSRIIELLIDFDVDRMPQGNPWSSYYGMRLAWGDATANLYRSVNMANVPTEAVQIEAPHFVDIRSGESRTTVLAGGLPYHRRFGLRKLDTLLIVPGETARSFRLGIGIDVAHPMSAAIGFLSPEPMVAEVPAPPLPTGWLFHVGARNVIVTHWEPLLEGNRVVGVCGRLLETDGRRTRCPLRSFRPIAEAHRIVPATEPPPAVPVDGDTANVILDAHEWAEVELRFGG